MFSNRILWIAVLALCLSIIPGHGDEMGMYRLPTTSKPLKYTLKIVPLTQPTPYFIGAVIIDTLILAPTNEIVLHSKNLTIKWVYVGCYARFSLDPDNEVLRITACRKLEQNKIVQIIIQFAGFYDQSSEGFYRSEYRVPSNKSCSSNQKSQPDIKPAQCPNEYITKTIVATQFKPSFARRAFPCYDEPHFKASFILYIARRTGQRTHSNMRPRGSVYDYRISPARWDLYDETPPMATHNLAFAVSEYLCEDTSNRIRACTRENALKNTHHLDSIGKKALDYMEAYTNETFHMPFLQFITLPDNNHFKVAENWGLITFRESLMLYDEEVSSDKDLEISTFAVCRGVAHQWFGDYLTASWWDNVWLNEGFTTYFLFYLANKIYPSWRIEDTFILQTLQPALFADQVTVYNSLRANVNTPREINKAFNAISYQKGAAIIRMLEHMVTPEVFQLSIRQYFKAGWKDSQGLVTPEILWGIFDQKVKEFRTPIHSSVSEVMNKWISNPGYPIVHVDRVTSRSKINVRQMPFKSPRSLTPTKSDAEWIIPLTYTKQHLSDFNTTTPISWLTPSYDEKKIVKDVSLLRDEWIIFNIRATGYYRVNYDSYNWKLLTLQLHQDHNKIHSQNRAQLIDDSLALAIDEYLPYVIPFELMAYLDKEQDMIPWLSALNKLNYLYSIYESTEAGPLLKKFILNRISNVYQTVGFIANTNDDHLTRTGRSIIVETACRLEMSECIEESVARYHQNSVNLSRISPDVKKAVLCAAVNNLQKEPVWINIWNAYKKSNVAQEKEIFLYALGCTNDSMLLRRFLFKLTYEQTDLEIQKQDYGVIFGSIFNRELGVDSGLQLIFELLPSMGYGILSTRTEDIMVQILNSLRPMINTENQVMRVKNLIMEAELMDEGMPKSFMEALYLANEAGGHQLMYRNKRMNNLIRVLGGKSEPLGGKSEPLGGKSEPQNPSSGYSVFSNFSSICAVVAVFFCQRIFQI